MKSLGAVAREILAPYLDDYMNEFVLDNDSAMSQRWEESILAVIAKHEARRWKRVEDELPEELTPVLVTNYEYNDPEKPRYYEVAWRNGEEWFVGEVGDGASVFTPTHWQPLPAPPKEER